MADKLYQSVKHIHSRRPPRRSLPRHRPAVREWRAQASPPDWRARHPLPGNAALAQLVEHIIRNDGVRCSSHLSGTSPFTRQIRDTLCKVRKPLGHASAPCPRPPRSVLILLHQAQSDTLGMSFQDCHRVLVDLTSIKFGHANLLLALSTPGSTTRKGRNAQNSVSY